MFSTRCALLLVTAVSGPLLAQGVAFSVPSDTPGRGACNAIPFGSANGSPLWENQRYQTLVTAADLANMPTIVTGLAFAPCTGGVHRSRHIRVTLAMVPAGFSFAAGNDDFDHNLYRLATSACVVLERTNHTWVKGYGQWSSLGIDRSFRYDGRSDLLVDIVVEGQSNSDGNGAMHRGGRGRLHAAGWTGQPPRIGTVSNRAAKIRVECGCADVTRFGRGCAGLEHTVGGVPSPGGALRLEMLGGEPGSPAWANLGTSNTAPFPVDMTSYGFTGCAVLCDGGIGTLPTATDGNGAASLSVSVPNSRALLGFRMFTQFVHLTPNGPVSFAASNGVRVVFGTDC